MCFVQLFPTQRNAIIREKYLMTYPEGTLETVAC